jgi:6-phosphofructokinase 2
MDGPRAGAPLGDQLLTLTMNPSVDISTAVDQVVPTRKLRCGEPRAEPGGGGVNVARVAQRLGAGPTAIVTSGGAHGDQLERMLADEGVVTVPVRISGPTRFALAVQERSTGQQFRFGLPGPRLRPEEWQRALAEVAARAVGGWGVLSGALPPGVPDDFYARAADLLRARGVRVALDTSGPALAASLRRGVDLVKPNVNELQSLVGRDLHGAADYESAAREVLDRGDNGAVVLSLGPVGALLVSRGRADATVVHAPAVRVRSTVGAGDSMVAGMVVALLQGSSLEAAVRWGVAAGTAATMAEGSGLCDAAVVRSLVEAMATTAP